MEGGSFGIIYGTVVAFPGVTSRMLDLSKSWLNPVIIADSMGYLLEIIFAE